VIFLQLYKQCVSYCIAFHCLLFMLWPVLHSFTKKESIECK
jgi:hypothetical protein